MADEKPTQDEVKPEDAAPAEQAAPVEDAPEAEEPKAETEEASEAEAEAETEDGPEAEPAMTPEELEEARASEVAFSWQASEYVHHHKGPGWYLSLVGGVVLLVALAVLLHLWVETALFAVMGAAVVVYARKPPRTLTYELTPKGITIEGKEYPFETFRSFGVLKDEDWHTIDLEPIKRLAPRLSILFDPDDFDAIVGHLELHLPRADREPDPIEKLSRYVRF